MYPQQIPIPAIAWNTPTVKVENQYDSLQKPELKIKKGRKNSMITCDIPVRKPGTAPPRVASPVTILPDSADPQSQDIIAKITAALQKHNFKSSDGAIQPAVLAKMVSSIVSNVNVEVMAGNKEQDLASSLATAMNRDAAPQESEPPPPQDTNKTRGRPKKKQRGRPRKDDTSLTVETEDVLTPRTKRQAAITAELKIETGKESPSVINLDDDSDAEYFPDECQNDSDPETETPKRPDKPIFEPKASTSKSATKPGPARTKANNESILLSDDEAPRAPSKSKSSDVVPLHISLLTNPNFVKIVAHTYLKGNPMMDEDAASLAAEYSTSKALKEVESMGKSSIDSGPIYEIAKEVC